MGSRGFHPFLKKVPPRFHLVWFDKNEMNFISISAASRRAGISRPAIRKHLKVGRIKSVDGKIDLASFENWLRNKSPSNETENIKDHETFDDPLEPAPVFGSLQDAELYKTSYEARLKEIEYDLKSQKVVLIEEVADRVSLEYARIRTRLLAIPAESAPQLFHCKTVMEVQDRLSHLINRVLEELSADEQWQEKLSERKDFSNETLDEGSAA